MRLGDLDALKEIFLQDRCGNIFLPKHFVISTIDNAPTVETDIEVIAKDAYKQGYTDGWKERFGEPNEIPQGEWNYIQSDMCVCPFCGAMPHKLYKNYCAKCGADMRGKKNETDN